MVLLSFSAAYMASHDRASKFNKFLSVTNKIVAINHKKTSNDVHRNARLTCQPKANGVSILRRRRARAGRSRGGRAPGVPVRGAAVGLRLHAGAGRPVAVHGLPVGQRHDARRAVVLLGALGHAEVEPGLPLHGARRHGRVARRRRRRRPRGAAARGVQGPGASCHPVQR